MLSYAVFREHFFLFFFVQSALLENGNNATIQLYELQCVSLRPSPHLFRPSRYSLNAATVVSIKQILVIVLAAKQRLRSLLFLMTIFFFSARPNILVFLSSLRSNILENIPCWFLGGVKAIQEQT